jgi:hypothetical protein
MAHDRPTLMGSRRYVTAHCRHAVARSVRLTGGLLGDEVFTSTSGEQRGDGRARWRRQELSRMVWHRGRGGGDFDGGVSS